MKVLHLNIERDKHLDAVFRLIEERSPDIICFEEAVDISTKNIAEKFGYEFRHAPLFSMTQGGAEGPAILSKFPILDFKKYHYGENTEKIPLVDIDKTTITGGNRPKDRFNYLYSILTILVEDERGNQINVATTHFTVTDHGTPGLEDHTFDETEDLREVNHTNIYFRKFLEQLKSFSYPLIFTSDLNNSRGEYIYDTLAHELADLMPKEIDSTLDPKLHKAKGLKMVVDTIMISPDIKANKVEIIEGVSDHKAILVDLEVIN